MIEYKSAIYWILTKLIIFFVVSGLVVFVDTRRHNIFNPEIITAALMFGVIAYLLISLIKNIGFLGTVVAAVAAGFGLDKLLNIGILTDESSFHLVLIVGVVFVLWDAWQVIQYFRYERYVGAGSKGTKSAPSDQDIIKTMRRSPNCPSCGSISVMLHMGTAEHATNYWECMECSRKF